MSGLSLSFFLFPSSFFPQLLDVSCSFFLRISSASESLRTLDSMVRKKGSSAKPRKKGGGLKKNNYTPEL